MKKKTIIIISIVVGVLLLLLIGAYIAVNVIFSMFSNSFQQVPLDELDKKPAIEQATPSPGVDGNQVDAESAPSPKPTQTGDVKVPDDLNLSEEKSKEMLDSVPFNEKMSVLTILNKNLSASEYRELIGMLSGGIASDEIKRAKEILRNSLSPEDKKTIKEYYSKYSGLLE